MVHARAHKLNLRRARSIARFSRSDRGYDINGAANHPREVFEGRPYRPVNREDEEFEVRGRFNRVDEIIDGCLAEVACW